jgi:hypothetical protein
MNRDPLGRDGYLLISNVDLGRAGRGGTARCRN